MPTDKIAKLFCPEGEGRRPESLIREAGWTHEVRPEGEGRRPESIPLPVFARLL